MDQVTANTSSKCNSQEFRSFLYQESRRKKRSSKLIEIGNFRSSSSSVGVSRPRFSKKPDPFAPKITAPCAVCGRKFWSWKALFGHMRCHPERQWRGINPPPNLIRETTSTSSSSYLCEEEDHEVAASLLLLASTRPNASESNLSGAIRSPRPVLCHRDLDINDNIGGVATSSCSRFECSSCKKVFGSHQALGGHRASSSHRNIKGCFKNTKNYDEFGHDDGVVEVNEMGVSEFGHQCSICFRVFSSGQALGGHKRCHWDKGEESLTLIDFTAEKEVCGLDLNLPDPMDDNSSCSFSSPVGLDLRLGL